MESVCLRIGNGADISATGSRSTPYRFTLLLLYYDTRNVWRISLVLVRRPTGLDQFFDVRLNNIRASGAVAQLGERLICIQEVVGSIPISSTIS